MRIALFASAIFLASHLTAARAATAYDALKTVGKQKGDALLENVTEVRGDNGAPEPSVWKVIAKGKSGVKEYSVKGGKIVGERAATGGGAALNMDQLSLDSDGAHTVADREAKKAGFTYDRSGYSLRATGKSGAPVWDVRLTDAQGAVSASLRIAATTGNVISSEGLTKRSKPVVAEAPAAEPRYQPEPRPEPEPRYQPEDREPRVVKGQRVYEGSDESSGRFGKHLERRGHQIGEFFRNLFTSDRRSSASPRGGSSPAPSERDEEPAAARPSRLRD